MLTAIIITVSLMHLFGGIVAWILYKMNFQELKTKMVVEPHVDWLYIGLFGWVSVGKILKTLK